MDSTLSREEKKELINTARRSIETKFKNQSPPSPFNITDSLKEPNGVFVTLKKHGQLRGCIGTFRASKPLYKTVQDMARAAAFEDYRFPPLSEDELKDIEIEISVLSPLKKIDSVEEIEVGKHGIYIIKDYHHGVLLPQVAVEYGWDRTTFLRHTCLKAGLNENCWKEGAEIYIFSAEIFDEKEIR